MSEMRQGIRRLGLALGAIAAARDAFVAMDVQGRITAWNPAAESLFGWTADEAIGRTVAETIVPEEQRERHGSGLARVAAGGASALVGDRVELEGLRRDGHRVPIELSISMSEDEDGRYFFAFIRDIGGRKRVEQALAASERRFRDLAEQAPVGIFQSDLEANWTYANPAWERLAGVPSERALGRGWQDLVHPDDLPTVVAERSAAAPEAELELDYRLVRPDGQAVWVISRSQPLLGADGTPVGRLGSVTDVTAIREAELSLERANADLETSNAQLEEFAYVASHDLQAPLRAVGGFVELLGRRYSGQLDDEADDYIVRIVSGVERMRALIDDLLRYSQVGRAELTRESVDTAAIVSEVLDRLREPIAEREVQVELGALPVVSGDPTLIEQLFANLVSNAVKFSDADRPQIEISGAEENGLWHFTVTDNGEGIDERYHDRIFEMFKRLHGRTVPGTGIGLAICKRAAERHGGRIWVESEPGLGSVFHFTISR